MVQQQWVAGAVGKSLSWALTGPAPFQEGAAKIGTFWYGVGGLCGLVGSIISLHAMTLHLKNYRRPDLQRMTLRIFLMVPIYALASFISLSSQSMSFYIDTARDLYEAFVIYTFFCLLINYMGGERELLIRLENRLRTAHLWPLNYVLDPVDLSNPETFLQFRRGVLQFVIVKPIISLLIAILKAFESYHEGYIAWNSSFAWLSLLYNASVCLSMYCLVIFYLQCHKDLAPYRPFPKFVSVKAIIFFSFWQSILISVLVAVGVIKGKEEKYTADNIAMALSDLFILLEIIPLALLHWYGFPWQDYDSTRLSTRLAIRYAVRDVFGVKDVLDDVYHTLRGTTFGVSEIVSEGDRVDRDMEDGRQAWVLGGDKRFWSRSVRVGEAGYGSLSTIGSPSSSSSAHDSRRWSPLVSKTRRKDRRVTQQLSGSGSYHEASRPNPEGESSFGNLPNEEDDFSDAESLTFDEPDDDEERGYRAARQMVFGDSNFPVISTDPRYSHPPRVQQAIQEQSAEWRWSERSISRNKQTSGLDERVGGDTQISSLVGQSLRPPADDGS